MRNPSICLSPIEQTHEAVGTAFVRIGPNSIPHLIEALSDGDPKIRLLAGRMLGTRFREAAMSAVVQATQQGKVAHTDGAARFFLCCSWYRPKAVEVGLSTIITLAGDPNYRVRQDAILTIYFLGSRAQNARATLEKALQDAESKEVREAASKALKRL